MISSNRLATMFFQDLKSYNSTNFRTIARTEISKDNPVIMKAFSSVITRFFIFCERHPEVSSVEARILFFKLKIDMIARYFSEYPDTENVEQLQAFKTELCNYIKDNKENV